MTVKAPVRWLWLAAFLVLVGPLRASSTDAALHYRGCQPPAAGARTVMVNIRYRTTPPTRVFAETASGADICFEHDEDAGQFVGQLPVAVRLTTYTIVAEMSPQQTIAINLEPPYRARALTLALPVPREGPCRPNLVENLGQTQTRDALLADALQARHWYRATSGCPASMKRGLAQRWFNLSYRSMAREEALLLDHDAALAYLRESPSDRAYIAGMIRRSAAIQAGKRSHHQEALAVASPEDALLVNLSIEAAIRGGGVMRSIYTEAGVSLPAVLDARARYQQQGRITAAALAHLRARMDPSIAIVPVTNIDQLAAEAGR